MLYGIPHEIFCNAVRLYDTGIMWNSVNNSKQAIAWGNVVE